MFCFIATNQNILFMIFLFGFCLQIYTLMSYCPLHNESLPVYVNNQYPAK